MTSIATYLSKNEFSYENFKKMKVELYSAPKQLEKKIEVDIYNEPKIEKQLSTLTTEVTETVDIIEIAAVTENKNPFEHNFKDWQFDILKECINEVAIFKSSISIEETKAIFDCKSQNNLRSRNNCVLAHFFQQLAKHGYNHQLAISNC